MKTVQVRLRSFFTDRSYPIRIGSGILLPELLSLLSAMKPSRIGVVADSHLAPLYSDTIGNLSAVAPVTLAEFPAGEANKTIETVMRLISVFAKAKLDRKSVIIGIGGGVTGDMTGFLASIYLRGVPFIQAPTSVLSMADSSVGGKTGVDIPEGKNLAGTFYQPSAVIIDTDTLKSLPKDEFVNGMAEVIKHGLITDASFFNRIAEERQKILLGDSPTLISMVEPNCRIKGRVVEKDEKEKGLRQTLNFGHTVGHAIERASDFRVPHGYAVALGMAAEGFISRRKGILPAADLERICAVLAEWGLLWYAGELNGLDRARLSASAAMDKKNAGGLVKAVMLERIGKVYRRGNIWSFDVSAAELEEALTFVSAWKMTDQ